MKKSNVNGRVFLYSPKSYLARAKIIENRPYHQKLEHPDPNGLRKLTLVLHLHPANLDFSSRDLDLEVMDHQQCLQSMKTHKRLFSQRLASQGQLQQKKEKETS